MRIFWKVHQLTPNIASIRYRCLIPIFESLQKTPSHRHFVRDVSCFDISSDTIDIAVFVKTTRPQDLLLAKELKKKGIPIVFDTCDNLFVEHKDEDVRAVFMEMLKAADKVTVPTQTLKNALLDSQMGLLPENIIVIPDPIENLQHIEWAKQYAQYRMFKDILAEKNLKRLSQFLFHYLARGIFALLKGLFHLYLKMILFFFPKSLKEEIENKSYLEINEIFPVWLRLLCFPYVIPFLLLRLVSLGKIQIPYKYRYRLLARIIADSEPVSIEKERIVSSTNEPTRSVDRINLLWFGNAGTFGTFGMSDILLIKDELEVLNQEQPITLTIISNDYRQFLKIQSQVSFACYYIPWTLEIVYKMAPQFTCAILPNPLNEFSKGKSANRSLLCLSMGLPVVATLTPELEKLSTCVSFDLWRESILRYAQDSAFKQNHLQNYQVIFKQSPHNPYNVWIKWQDLLQSLINS
ncbi:MAG: hypothetical protein H6623_01265 [Bdellovibrionaceae bacterium]|nr:hypothetical protein [Pseudobdellovibrionaceae bacterium]